MSARQCSSCGSFVAAYGKCTVCATREDAAGARRAAEAAREEAAEARYEAAEARYEAAVEQHAQDVLERWRQFKKFLDLCTECRAQHYKIDLKHMRASKGSADIIFGTPRAAIEALVRHQFSVAKAVKHLEMYSKHFDLFERHISGESISETRPRFNELLHTLCDAHLETSSWSPELEGWAREIGLILVNERLLEPEEALRIAGSLEKAGQHDDLLPYVHQLCLLHPNDQSLADRFVSCLRGIGDNFLSKVDEQISNGATGEEIRKNLDYIITVSATCPPIDKLKSLEEVALVKDDIKPVRKRFLKQLELRRLNQIRLAVSLCETWSAGIETWVALEAERLTGQGNSAQFDLSKIQAGLPPAETHPMAHLLASLPDEVHAELEVARKWAAECSSEFAKIDPPVSAKHFIPWAIMLTTAGLLVSGVIAALNGVNQDNAQQFLESHVVAIVLWSILIVIVLLGLSWGIAQTKSRAEVGFHEKLEQLMTESRGKYKNLRARLPVPHDWVPICIGRHFPAVYP